MVGWAQHRGEAASEFDVGEVCLPEFAHDALHRCGDHRRLDAVVVERVIHTLFFKSPILTLIGLGVVVAGVVVLIRRRRAVSGRLSTN